MDGLTSRDNHPDECVLRRYVVPEPRASRDRSHSYATPQPTELLRTSLLAFQTTPGVCPFGCPGPGGIIHGMPFPFLFVRLVPRVVGVRTCQLTLGYMY